MKTERILSLSLSALFLGLFLHQCFENKSYKGKLNQSLNHKTETIFSEKPYKVPNLFDNSLQPLNVVFYPNPDISKPVNKVILIRDTIRLYTNDNRDSTLNYHTNFLTFHPYASKLVNLNLTSNSLQLDLLAPEGSIYSEYYPLNLTKYDYRYQENRLSFKKKKLKLNFEASYSFRPLNNFHDIDLMIKFDTNRFTYGIGLNTYIYPTFDKPIGFDPIFKVTYRF